MSAYDTRVETVPATLRLRCACGAVSGRFAASADAGARGVCHCDDCQAWGRSLGGGVLDQNGGTEVIQTWPARVALDRVESLRVARLSERGMLRWYAGCCNTPVANTFHARPRLPFVGLVARFVVPDQAAELEAIFGRAPGVQGRFARGGCPPGVHPSAPFGVVARAIALLARGFLRGAHRPNPFLFDDGRPRVEPRVLTAAERDALRDTPGTTTAETAPGARACGADTRRSRS